MIREKIRQRIVDLDLKQVEVCNATDIPTTTLSLYVNGHTHLPIARIVKLMDFLGLTFGYEGELVGRYGPEDYLKPVKERMSEYGIIQAELARKSKISRYMACTFLNKGIIGELALERVMDLLNLTIVSYSNPKLKEKIIT